MAYFMAFVHTKDDRTLPFIDPRKYHRLRSKANKLNEMDPYQMQFVSKVETDSVELNVLTPIFHASLPHDQIFLYSVAIFGKGQSIEDELCVILFRLL